MNDTMTTMDGISFVERYAWFGYFVSFRRRKIADTLLTNTTYTETGEWLRIQYVALLLRPGGYFTHFSAHIDMLNTDGSLNSLGQLYIGADTVETSGPATNTAAGIPVGGEGGPTPTLGTVSVGSGQVPTFVPNSAVRGGDGHAWGVAGLIGWMLWMWI